MRPWCSSVGIAVMAEVPQASIVDAKCEPQQWFAVWTRNRCEPKVRQTLSAKGLEVFVPSIRQASRRRDRRVMLDRPLLPGYALLRFAPSRAAYLQVMSTDGVVRILGERWDSLSPVPDEEVEAIRRIVTTAQNAGSVPWLRQGDRVRILAGPLQGLEGFVQDWRSGRARFVISVDLLQRSVGVEVASEILERL